MRSVDFFIIRVGVLVAGSIVIGAAFAANPATANGVQAMLRPFGLTTCTNSGACVAYKNTGSGAAIKGTGTTGTGVVTVSSSGVGLVASSDSGLAVEAASSTNTGVRGSTVNPSSRTKVSRAGIYGLDGSSDTGLSLNTGVTGFSSFGTGVEGVASQGRRGVGTGLTGGVVGVGTASASGGAAPGVVGVSIDTGDGGYIGVLGMGVTGMEADGVSDGLDASTRFGYGVLARTGDPSDILPTIAALAASTTPTTNSLVTFDGNESPTFWVDNGGDAHVRGLIFTSGPCSAGCARTKNSPAKVVQRYVPQESMPTMEDFGEGRLSGGSAYVRIDAAFANVIDARSEYLVFITPQGPTHGLYVANKTAAGFEVVEDGGRSSIAFDYRIVAKPFGVDRQRLPMLSSSTLPKADVAHHNGRRQPPLNPM